MGRLKQSGCWLRSSIITKESVIAHWIESSCAEDVTAKPVTEAADLLQVVGERSVPVKVRCKACWRVRSANADMSSAARPLVSARFSTQTFIGVE